MKPKEAYEKYKKFKVPSLSKISGTASEHSITSLVIIILLVVLLALALQYIPHLQVAQFNITNQKDLADAENSYRATLAQIFGGVAIFIGLYYTWRRNSIAEEGQITERFTRAIDQLGAVDQKGNQAIEIRLGGIYALERIANESEKDYWPIIEILTAYIRKNSIAEISDAKPGMGVQASENKNKKISEEKKVSLDVEAILTVITKHEFSYNNGEGKNLNLTWTYLAKIDLSGANLQGAKLLGANLKETNLKEAHLEGATLEGTYLEGAYLEGVNLQGAKLLGTWLSNSHLVGANFLGAYCCAFFYNANLQGANFKGADLRWAKLQGANLEGANLEGANLVGTNLKGAKNLTVDQLFKVKTLYKAQLDPKLEAELRTKGLGHLLDDEPK